MDWNERYARFGNVFGEDPHPWVVNCVSRLLTGRASAGEPSATGPSVPASSPAAGSSSGHDDARRPRLLFPGDGCGRNGLWAAEAGCSVVAFDISEIAVNAANTRARQRGLDYASIVADANALASGVAWPFGELDGICSVWFRPGTAAQYAAWNALAASRLGPAGEVCVVTSDAVSSEEREPGFWPEGLSLCVRVEPVS